ncbi:MAG: hypothetical protein JWM75_2758, partial [Sphingomonas bacterium]|nr:hypothetical protein [Sphingomonas bacterium]
PDSIWPNSRAAIQRQMGHMPPELIKKLTHDNAAKLYKLDMPATVEMPVAAE